ncbi:MAG: protease inhibitor I42 family protein [Phycisphaerae bacterium]|jgi:hypothetical protein|nr:protease inhibitor I42 family protein [Phycisphaerae bacterium]MDP7287330.1 protease inhibitor I42 family protein [Phycisphaerae bacterium]
MKRLVLIITAGVLLGIAADVSAAEYGDRLCRKCAKLAGTGSLGKCSKCPGQTLGRAFKLCGTCSMKTGQCQRCPARISRPAAPKRPVAAGPIEPISLSLADSGRTVAPRIGQRIVVRLKGNPTTDYSWSVASIRGSAVRRIGKLAYSPPGPGAMDGAGGSTPPRSRPSATEGPSWS